MFKTREAMDRRIAFWQRQMRDRILVSFGVRNPRPTPSRWQKHVEEKGLKVTCCYDRPPLFECLEDLLRQYEMQIGARFDPDAERELDSDAVGIPMFCPTVHFGEGIVGAFFGGELIFSSTDTKTNSVCKPVVTDWAQLDSLRFEESSPWVQRALDCLRFFVARGDKRFALQPYCTIDALNFAVVMRGDTQAFLDVKTSPRELRRLMEAGLDQAVRFWKLQREIIEENNKRVIQHDAYAALCPGHAGAGLSADAYSLCHPSVYEEMGFEYTQRLIHALGGGFLHTHSIGAHLVPLVAKLDGLTELSLADDPHCERYFPKLRFLRERTGDVPLTVICTLAEFTTGLRDGTLPGGVSYGVQGAVDTMDDAKRLMEKVRAYRATV